MSFVAVAVAVNAHVHVNVNVNVNVHVHVNVRAHMVNVRAHMVAIIMLLAAAACASPDEASSQPGSARSDVAATTQDRTIAGGAPSPATAWLDALRLNDLAQIDRTVAAIVALPPGEADPDVLLAAARACEDSLLDPGRALAIYERIAADHPTARAAAAAERRLQVLRAQIGPGGEGAERAAELARLVATADAEAAEAVIARADRLANAAWPGAPTAALWLADWLRRAGRFDEAQARYAAVSARWPATPQAQTALRSAAGCALDAHRWSLAEDLARPLPAVEPGDRALRDDLLAAAARGRQRDRWYVIAWVLFAGALAALLGSLIEAARRGPAGSRWRALRPPLEVVFLAPVVVVLIGVALTTHRLIAPAVATIALGGLALTWLSGAALDQLRATGRAHRARSVAHILVCLAAVAALGYIALHRDDLLDLLIATVRFGPDI